ncbi:MULTISPECIES: (2Fe-2S) ferredoxin domain-containing protein [Clostridia]|uniref:(2Fe-2S) ferredoxin domain-containing protein n=1 Tax=Clostridium sp. CCUG 7971 TaxID=2811414 RepID=UPI001ABBA246|nr:(2Fe-2S) ferredoxin domain-containing protein [Clostridium sp. CCUG 7971]MBO3444612.1 (2Fe-2S) ferredoxin domain-containing protein [Clostridium sp. CCUG 7971]
MKSIKICIGSACHIKGSEEVIEIFKNLISEYNLEDEVELLASFCLGKCTQAVSVMRWDGEVLSVCQENAKDIFEKNIIPYI